jgi:phage baseplate assembly protein W
MNEPGAAHIGRGWAFPVRWSAAGAVEMASGEEDVRQAIRLILRTGTGERAMRPDFGAGVDRFVFDTRTVETCARLQTDVELALLLWEPRIALERVVAQPSPDDQGRIDVLIEYRIKAYRHRSSLVYPFYLQQPGSPRGSIA